MIPYKDCTLKITVTRAAFTILFVFASISFSFGWGPHGHMLVASVAYDQLSAQQKKNITELLMNHPDYEPKWKKGYQAVKNDMDLGMYLVMQASTWPDVIRSAKNVNHKFHRPEWHYVDYRVEFPNHHDHTLPDGPKGNVVWAIDYARNKVNDTRLDAETRAMFLAWLIHLVGDIHQPLHCASLFNDNYPEPDGDRGGNLFFVRKAATGNKLHSVWDGAPGSSTNVKSIVAQSAEIQQAHPPTDFNLAYDPEDWSVESFNLAIKKAYKNGKLEGATDEESAPPLPAGYVDDMNNIVLRQCAEGGYRLGDIMSDLSVAHFREHDE